ncbi:MAG TPA: serine protease [bacterium]|nr:serine protease [bacterium]HNB10394.1 serine protease [bacterium]HNB57315.1 serine protease [bacterium]HNF86654.1 serine protease [bacterium]HNH31806.1 serine protease [bacterium]
MKTLLRTMVIIAFGLLLSCSSRIRQAAYPTLFDNEYDSEFPYRSSSDQLEEISASVKIMFSTAFYNSYYFDEKFAITPTAVRAGAAEKYAYRYLNTQASVSGTATVIYYDTKRVALLTCAHVVEFSDTVYSYYPSGHVQSVSFLQRQSNFIRDLPEGGELEVLAIDSKNDIAIIGRSFDHIPQEPVHVFGYPIGQSKKLRWGSFVYVIGYPMGFKMVTKGTVSSPNRDRNGSFLTDAPMNEGLSGGIVLAIKDGVPNFELVGVAKSISATQEYYLMPDPGFTQEIPAPSLYKGELYARLKTEYRYGITHVVSTEILRSMYEKYKKSIDAKGYSMDALFK